MLSFIECLGGDSLMTPEELSNLIMTSSFEEVREFVANSGDKYEFEDFFISAFDFTDWDFRCYGLLNYLNSIQEEVIWHRISYLLLSFFLNYIKGSEDMALIHLRRLIEIEGHTTWNLLGLIKLARVPEGVVSVEEGKWAAYEALKINPDEEEARYFLSAYCGETHLWDLEDT